MVLTRVSIPQTLDGNEVAVHSSGWPGLFYEGCLIGLWAAYISNIIFPLIMIAFCMHEVKQELTKFQSLTKMINSEPAWGRDLPGCAEKPAAEGKLAGCGAQCRHKQEIQQLARGLTDGLGMVPLKWAQCLTLGKSRSSCLSHFIFMSVPSLSSKSKALGDIYEKYHTQNCHKINFVVQ